MGSPICGPGPRKRNRLQSSNLSSTPKNQTPTISIFGVQIDGPINDDQGLQQAVSAGAHWVRFDAFDWDRIEPKPTSPATYRWEEVDEASLLKAAGNGLEIIAVVKYIPRWAQKYLGSACGPIHSEVMDRFGNFLSSLVRRYKKPPYNIKYWELGNEIDAPP